MSDDVLTVAEAAARLRYSPKRVRELARAGALRASKPGGGEWRIRASAVDELLAATESAPTPVDGRTFRSRAAPAARPAPLERGTTGSFRSRATRRSEAA